MTPRRVVAPVNSEVLFSAGICGTDGYLQMNEPLEWMLTPDSVGTIIAVGDDEPGVVGKLVGTSRRPEKRDGSYAVGITGTKPMLITRGNSDPSDDVKLEKGQTWLSLSSPSEGVSRLTVMAPESECWDQRRTTATIYWVDARWQFPGPKTVPAGTSVELITRVTRSEGTLPARGWKVRYEILQPELATFEGTGGSTVVEAVVDENGDAKALLVPNGQNGGTATINMQVIRPGGDRDDLPTLTLGTGQTYVTWSSPGLAIRAGGPSTASFNTSYTVFANVSNPGDQPATDVKVELPLPPGTRALRTDTFGRILPSSVSWDIGTLPPNTQIDLTLDLVSQSSVRLPFVARADGLVAESVISVDVFQPSLTLNVRATQDRVEVGEDVRFLIDVTNTSNTPLSNAQLIIRGDEGMVHRETGGREIADRKDTPLQPGDTWEVEASWSPTSQGNRCIEVEATTDGGQLANGQACVLAINPIPDTPLLTARIDGPNRLQVGQKGVVTFQVFNEGRGPARNVRVNLAFDPQLAAEQATNGVDKSRLGQNILQWTLPLIAAGTSEAFEVEVRGSSTTPSARVRAIAESEATGKISETQTIEVTNAPFVPSPSDRQDLPPSSTPPAIPGGPGQTPEPLTGNPNNVSPPPPAPERSGRLQLAINTEDAPVRVGDLIRYTIVVFNDTEFNDGDVDIAFRLPDGVSIKFFVPTTNPELGVYEFKNGVYRAPLISNLDSGEQSAFELVLIANQPQTFDLIIQVSSANQPNPQQRFVRTKVIP
ncbi:MAG: hypothetical protein AAF664_04075 [Planctomycetota bacterium]